MDSAKGPQRYVLDGQFRILPGTNSGTELAECMVCGAKLKYHHSTSTLKYHLSKKHPFTGKKTSSGTDASQSQPSILMFTKSKAVSEKRRDEIVKAICMWLGRNMRPVNMLDDEGLSALLQTATDDPSFTLPGRTCVMGKMKDLYDNEKGKQMEKLESAESVVLAFDHWTSGSQDNYMGVTAVFLTDSFHLIHTTLGIYCSNEAQTGENICNHMMDVIEQWNLSAKVFSLCSDNAANMMKASRLLKLSHLPCMAHTLQLSINHGLKESGIASTLAKARTVVGKVRKSPKQKEQLKKMGCKHMLVSQNIY